MRRRLIALPAAVLAASLVLGACSSDPDDGGESGSASSSESAGSDAVENVVAGDQAGFTASGEFGEKPTLEFTADSAPEGLQVEVVSEGDGPEVTAEDTISANYLGQVWDTDTVFDNSYDRGAPTEFPLSGVIAGWTTGLTGQKVGSRVLLTVPSALGYPDGQGEDIKAGDTIVFVVDIVGIVEVPPADSVGQADAVPTGAEVPVTITGDLGAPVTAVTVAEGALEPTEPTATVIATGTGAPLALGDSIYLQYTLTTWDNASTETTWPPDGIGISNATLGQGSIFDQIVDVPRGSRVLFQVPGDAASGSPALAVVVDVIGE